MATIHPPRFFYGWLIVLIAFFTTFVIAGTFVTFGQFINPLARTFGWSVGLIGLASTVRQLTTMGSALVVGRLTDRAGPRRVMTAGALVAGGVAVRLAVRRPSPRRTQIPLASLGPPIYLRTKSTA